MLRPYTLSDGSVIRLGVTSFKIEGRLKTPEYVAAVTRAYRKAIDAALESSIWIAGALWIATASPAERLRLIDGAPIGAAFSGIVLMAQAVGRGVLSSGPEGPSGRLGLTGLTGTGTAIEGRSMGVVDRVTAMTGQ